ncbi:MAG: GlsB/YeaQ/YmgE family stress response membrane protein [Alphaproteobacteria bacterium]|nr:GlsB/YeaQ/YmgE family stress response membrane protein [Alphaproteobacteria bacterium]MBV9370059.1 GlsB/YeaQ/YmgE family stress response membrane protein [Alphaproteobacteria bacterium]MBV9900733.1 GlsB/YeaQ/YmgE family stress response membrane protein [Alphaproteobacteria bacterium]
MNLLADHGWIMWIIIGAVAGAVAKALMPGRDPGGCIVTILLGIGGAVLAGYLGHALNIYPPSRGADWIAAIIGAMIILGVWRLIAGRR